MRVLVISDIHGNLVALETVLAAAEGQFDTIWCLGDVVGYGPRPNECVELIREQADLCVVGNHDWAVLGRPGINVDDFNPQARQAVLWTREQLTAENRDYLAQLPEQPVSPPGSEQFLVTHASPREPVWEYILTPGIALENFAVFDQLACLVGHTHKPIIYRWQLHNVSSDGEQMVKVDQLRPDIGEAFALDISATRRLIMNPGSVGQPRDNDARAAYVILDLSQMSWRQERVAYPVDLTQSQMRAANLPRRLIDRLSFGW
jgi:predicted phosphodiesterase